MSSATRQGRILLNPHYGSGCYRRGIRLTNTGPAETVGELHDNLHAMRCTIQYDGGTISAVLPEFVRFPMNTCPGAAEPARELAGTRLDVSFGDFFGGGRALRQCSHVYDLIWLAMRHAGCGDGETRFYEVEIPDQVGPAPQRVSLALNGEAVLSWQVVKGTIVSPEPFAGRPVLKGLLGWARDALDDRMLEATMILQKGYLVSGSRRYQLAVATGPFSAEDEVMRGSCWTYSSPRFEQAVRQISQRDLSSRDSLQTFG